jgi:hypothetical protein
MKITTAVLFCILVETGVCLFCSLPNQKVVGFLLEVEPGQVCGVNKKAPGIESASL